MLSRHKVGIGALVLLLAVLMFATGRQGLSDFYALLAQQEIDRGAGTPRQNSADQLPRTLGYLDKALAISPANAWPLQLMMILRVRKMQFPSDTTPGLENALVASTATRAALQQRPTSAFAWSQLAQVKMGLNEKDRELWQALANAQELGPWETDVIMTVMTLGLSLWPQADAAMRERLLGTMERAARRNLDRSVFIVTMLNRLDVFCDLKYVKLSGVKACAGSALK